ncbi:hypothetical protein [Bacteroides sp. 51]|uniref:hypothetical protein n=1 Tax=Bacteroides sp. 51 TaxID=2302938 RepID=UPI0013D85B36|nr:hypothetical protein [Bacteroides sp. 51]NDV82061.1 hypothetical protein [Bacteroides sp. 51]
MRRETIIHNILYGTLLTVNLILIFLYTTASEPTQEAVEIPTYIANETHQSTLTTDTCVSWQKRDIYNCPLPE